MEQEELSVTMPLYVNVQENQMEADCTVIEESLLERQIGHETASLKESLEYPAP